MPNWVKNCVTLKGAGVQELLDACNTVENEFSFNGIVPMPENVFRGNLGLEEERKYPGELNWYGWSVRNWGTKWDSCYASVSRSGDDEAYVEFDTAWSAPIPVYWAIMKKFPKLDVYVEYADEDIGNNCGTWHNGEETVPGNPIGFACDVWGWDEEEYRDEYLS